MASLGITWWFPVVGETLAEADVCAYNCIVAVNSERWRHCQGVVEEYIPLVMPTLNNPGELAFWYHSLIEMYGVNMLPCMYRDSYGELMLQLLPQLPPNAMVDHPPTLSAPNPQLPPSTMTGHSPVLSVPEPIRSSGCVRQPRAVKRVSPYIRRTQAARAKAHNGHYSDEEVEILLDVIDAQRPTGPMGWKVTADLFNQECQLRSIDTTRDDGSLQRKFKDLAGAPKPSGEGVISPDIERAKRLSRILDEEGGSQDLADKTRPATQGSLPTVRAVKTNTSLPRSTPRQPSSKGDEFVSKITNYLDERSSSSSSSSGINTTLVLMTSQNGELRSQNSELRSQVDRYRMEVDRLEKKLDKFRKKSDMADLVDRLANHSITPRSPSVPDLTQRVLALSTSEQVPSPDLQSQHIPPSDLIPGPPIPTMGRITRFCPDGTEVWYPGNEMPGDFQLNAANANYDPYRNVSVDNFLAGYGVTS